MTATTERETRPPIKSVTLVMSYTEAQTLLYELSKGNSATFLHYQVLHKAMTS